MRLVTLSPEQIAEEIRNAASATEADRVWRRRLRRVVAAAFVSQAIATGVGAAGFAVGRVRVGWILMAAGQLGVVLFPFLIGVLWVVEAHRRGDL